MNWILIALATNSFMGSYASEQDCQAAIHARVKAGIMAPAIYSQMDAKARTTIDQLADKMTAVQMEYICTKRG